MLYSQYQAQLTEENVSDKIRQAIDEVDIEVSDPERYHIDRDLRERLANKIAHFISKGVGNPNVVYDILKKVHEEGKYPAITPQGRGDNLRDYTDRIIAMFAVSSGVMKLEQQDGKKMLVLAQQSGELTDKQKAQRYEEPEPVIPKASEKRAPEYDTPALEIARVEQGE